MNAFPRFLLQLTLFSAIVFIAFFFTEPYLPEKVKFPSFWMIQIIMILATLVFHFGLVKSAVAGGQPFVRYFMGATSVKLFVFMMIMVLYGVVIKEKAFAFILHFFVLYLFYTTFEAVKAYRTFGAIRRKA